MPVWAIRGATTVENNTKKDIIDSTKELLNELIISNNIKYDDIISAIFTVTKDLDSAFPAVSARQLGWMDIALLCSYEIDVPGSLKKCIRVLMHVNSDKNRSDLKHAYLKGAKSLRPDLSE